MATILVVDDEPTIVETVAAVLTEEGYAVRTASDGLAAQELLTGLVPDLVLTDTMMPGLGGPGLVAWMRTQPALQQLPVVLMSATARPVLESLESAVFLPKPFDLDELVTTIDTVIGHLDSPS